MKTWQEIIDKYYESGSRLREILICHSRSVADMALEIVDHHMIDIDRQLVVTAAMLHDIGICRCYAPGIYCHGDKPYICHGIEGADMLRAEQMPESIIGVALHHTGAGLTRDDIIRQQLPLPIDDYLPVTLLERLICYADKYYSKGGSPERKSLDRVMAQMKRFGDDSLDRFMQMHRSFG